MHAQLRAGETLVLSLDYAVGEKGLNNVLLFKHRTFRGDINRLRRLGSVLHLSPSRNIIVKAEESPKIGEPVVDENLKPVGTIFDVFGPVSSPYVAIRPTARDPERLVGKKLYVIPSKRRKEQGRNDWRRRA